MLASWTLDPRAPCNTQTLVNIPNNSCNKEPRITSAHGANTSFEKIYARITYFEAPSGSGECPGNGTRDASEKKLGGAIMESQLLLVCGVTTATPLPIVLPCCSDNL